MGLTCGCGFWFVSWCFGFQTHSLLDWTSEGCCVVLPYLLEFDACGNNTSLGTLAKLVRSFCMVALRTRMYSWEYVSLATYCDKKGYIFSFVVVVFDDWAFLVISFGTQINFWFVCFCLPCLGTHLSVVSLDGFWLFWGLNLWRLSMFSSTYNILMT